MESDNAGAPRVVIVGGGFAGLSAARALARAPVQVTVIDRENHHLFQPLLYQVATALLSPADIAAAIRTILRHQRNARVEMAEVTGVDTARQVVITSAGDTPYDYLLLATGARHSYFGHPEWEAHAPGLKSIADATIIRERVLSAFERAELEPDPAERGALLTFAIVGAGPTGVELAGTLVTLARRALAPEYRSIDTRQARILLIEAAPRILGQFPGDLAGTAHAALERMGVEVRVGLPVESVDAEGITAGGARIACRTTVWAAGVAASPAGKWLAVATDRAGRVPVGDDLAVPGLPNVFVAGDTAAREQDGRPLPGVAPVAMQQGRHAARVIAARVAGRPPPPPFRYRDKGALAFVGRAYAIADFGRLKVRGWPAWVLWLGVHLMYLIGFRSRLLVLIQWVWSYVTYQQGARLIVRYGPPDDPSCRD